MFNGVIKLRHATKAFHCLNSTHQPRIGIARALYSYYHYPLFKTFFETLGFSVLTSPATTKEILKSGIEYAPAEICLPVKTYLGHIAYLKDKVDYLFIPRIVCIKSNHKIRFGCPKAIGLPDLIRATFLHLPPILELTWDERVNSLKDAFFSIAQRLGKERRAAFYAYKKSIRVQSLSRLRPSDVKFWESSSNWEEVKNSNNLSKGALLNVGVVGHPYLLFDNVLSLGIIDRLKNLGAAVSVPTDLSTELIQRSAAKYDELSWIYEQEILGSAVYFLHRNAIDGLLLVSSFACGTAAVVNEIISLEVAPFTCVPTLVLLLDEHSAEAGIMTRLESFVDMILFTKQRNQLTVDTHQAEKLKNTSLAFPVSFILSK